MCKHDEGIDMSPGLAVIASVGLITVLGTIRHNVVFFFILFNEAESGLATVPSNTHLQSVYAAVRTVCGNSMTCFY